MNSDGIQTNFQPTLKRNPGRFRLLRVLVHIVIAPLTICWMTSFSLAQISAGGDASSNEERLEAASLFKFPNYIEWPAESFATPASPFVFGVVGADEIADALAGFSVGRTINNRQIVVKRLQPDSAVSGIHVLFVGKAERTKQPHILKQLQSRPVLVVTETEGALTQGSMINFRIVDERVRFEVALDPVERSGLILNSRILSVALHVLKESPQ